MRRTIFLNLTNIFFLSLICITSNAQLQKSNSIKIKDRKEKLELPLIRASLVAPEKIDLKISEFDSSKDSLFSARFADSSRENDLVYENQKIDSLKDKLENVIQLEKNARKVNSTSYKRITQLENEVKNITSLLESARIESKKKEERLTKEKNAFRKEYYISVVKEAKQNLQTLQSKYKKIRTELQVTKDSLSLDSWPSVGTYNSTSVKAIVPLYTSLFQSTDAILNKLSLIEADTTAIKEQIDQLTEFSTLEKHQFRNDRYLDSMLTVNSKQLNQIFEKESSVFNAFQDQRKEYTTSFNLQYKEIEKILEVVKSENGSEQSADANLLANFTQPLNQGATLIPEIDIFGFKKWESESTSIFGQAKLFLAAPGSDTNSLNQATRFFVPEASQFGFSVDMTFSFIPKHYAGNKPDANLLGINFGFAYLQKQLQTKDSIPATFSTGNIQFYTGVEIIIVKNILALYGNLNGIFVGKGLDKFNQHYTNNGKTQWYSEIGLRSYLDLKTDAKLKILLDLRFIPIGNTVRTITNSSDKFIPLMKLGIVKDFKF